jgi:hypothetical protein
MNRVKERDVAMIQQWIHTAKRLLTGRDRGTVAVTFLLSFPLLLLIYGIIVQFALLANAKIAVNHATAAAGRAAMTSLPTDPLIEPIDGPGNVSKAACLALEPLSPVSPNPGSDALAIAQAFKDVGINVPGSFAGQYEFTSAATTVQILPIDVKGNVIPTDVNYAQAARPRARITVTYRYHLNVPAINMFSSIMGIGVHDSVAGVDGYYFPISTTLDVQLSDGREVPTNANGEP